MNTEEPDKYMLLLLIMITLLANLMCIILILSILTW